MARKRSPRDKKILDYQKERRNAYGENDKSSRKSIKLRKSLVNRNYRRSLGQATRLSNLEVDDLTAKVDRVRRSSWKKKPDEPLATHIDRPWGVRQDRDGDQPTHSELRDEAHRRLRRSKRRSI